MVVERFADGWKDKVYEHFEKYGRMLPEGLEYLGSWRVKDNDMCFQLMQTRDYSLFAAWQSNWDAIGLWGSFEIFEIES
jgi:hypothetical protein